MKGPCPKCSSSDGCHTYEDGHSYCFVCETYTPAEGENAVGGMTHPKVQTKISRSTMEDLKEANTIALKKRRISQRTCKHYGYVVADGKQVAKYYRGRNLMALHFRTSDKRFYWEGDQDGIELFGQHLFPKGGKRLVITEGEIDCLSVAEVMQCKWPVVSLPSGAQSAEKHIKANLEWVNAFDEVVLAFDNDEAGKKATEKVLRLISPGKGKTLEYPEGCKDANDMLLNGHDIVKAVWNAAVYRPDGIVSAKSLKDELDCYFENGYEGVQFECPLPLLNWHTNGYRKGELWTHTAGSGIGKSTVTTEILAHHLLKTEGLTIGHVALEENCKQTVMRYMSLELNKPIHLDTEGVTKEQWDEAFEAITCDDRLHLYDHFGSLDASNLLDKLRYLAVGCGCDFILLDHISIAVSGMDIHDDERRTLDKLMTDLRSLVEETGVGIHVISHLKKAEGKPHEEGGRVRLDDLRGSASLKQLSDVVIGYERDQQADDDSQETQVRVLKCRLTGRTGAADVLIYDEQTGHLKVKREQAEGPIDRTDQGGGTDF